MARPHTHRNYQAATTPLPPPPPHVPLWGRTTPHFIALALALALIAPTAPPTATPVPKTPTSNPKPLATDLPAPIAHTPRPKKPTPPPPRRKARPSKPPRPKHLDLIKVGDSLTTTPHFLGCLEHPGTVSKTHPRLEPTRQRIAGRRLLARKSHAAGIGWHAGRALRGRPTPLDREIRATHPTHALVLLGSNDVQLRSPARFETRLAKLLDHLDRAKVRAILSTIPPRAHNPWAQTQVPLYNAVIQKLATQRRIPLIHLHDALEAIPGHGLTADGIHLDVYRRNGRARPCDFSPSGLKHGHNVRNLLTLKAIGRL